MNRVVDIHGCWPGCLIYVSTSKLSIMIHTYFKSLTLEMLLEMLIVSGSRLRLDRINKADAEDIKDVQKVICSLKKAIVAKRAEIHL